MDAAAARVRRLHALGIWAPWSGSPGDAVRRLVALQAQEFPYALWGVAQRLAPSPDAAAMNVAYDLGELLRTHVLRPTWHFVAPEDARWLLTLSAPRVHQLGRTIYAQNGLDAETLVRTTDLFAGAVDAGRHSTRARLREVLDGAGIRLPNQGFTYALMFAELERVLISGATDGRQRTYAAFDERVPPGFVGGAPEFDRERALGELTARYLGTRGPASLKDLAVWSGLTLADCRLGLRIALELAPGSLESVELDGIECWLPAAQPAPTAPASPHVDLLQGYDEYAMSYSPTRFVGHPAGYQAPRVPVSLLHGIAVDGVLAAVWRHEVRADAARVQAHGIRELAPAELTAIHDAVTGYGRHLGVPTSLELV